MDRPNAIRRHQRGVRRVVVWVAVVMTLGVCGRARAAPSARALLADQLVMLARQSLANREEPREDQLVRARLLLDLALETNREDAPLWRLSMELAHRAGDPKTEYEALRRYCALRPQDDAAQLKWIMGMVGLRQTLPDRVEAVRKILNGREASRLSAALRSRLASYLAQAALESGDTTAVVRYLQHAISLDRSNLEAAKLATDWLEAAGATADKVGESLMHLIRANPVDPLPRHRLARLLLSQGAYRVAAQQYQVVQRLASSTVDERFVYNWVLSVAGSGEIEEAVRLLAQYEAMRSPRVAGSQLTAKPAAARTGLPMDLELLRLAILHQSDQRGRAAGSYQRLVTLLQKRAQAGDAGAKADLMWLGLLFDHAVPDDKALADMAADRPADDPMVTRLKGWSSLRQGDLVAAEQALKIWYVHEDPFEAYGLAKVYQAAGDPRYPQQLQQVIRLAPSNLAGVLASLDLIGQGVEPQPADAGARLTRLIDGWPSMLATPNLQTEPWWRLTVDVEPKRYGYLKPISARLRLRNMTNFPLSLGPDGVVPTDVVVHTLLRRRGASAGTLSPIAVDMDRRIRLGPYEAIDLEVRLDRAELGLLLSLNPAQAVSVDITTVLDPRIGRNGRIVPGPLGGSDSAHLIERFATAMTMQNVQRWIAALDDTEPHQQMTAAALLVQAASVLAGAANKETQSLAKQISEAVEHAYHQWNPRMQAWVVRFLVAEDGQDGLFQAIRESVLRSDDALVWIVYLATQVSDPEAVVVNTALRHSDTRVVQFARALREGLEIAAAEPDPQNTDLTDVAPQK